jgi:chromate reductase
LARQWSPRARRLRTEQAVCPQMTCTLSTSGSRARQIVRALGQTSIDSLLLTVGDMRVVAVCGSLQAKSGNLELLKTAAASVPAGVEIVLFDGLRNLPHFDPDIEAAGVPVSVTQWRLAVSGSDAVLIASPEYGFSLPGALKNGIDWLIGSGELEQKVVAITSAVAGPERGRRGLDALRVTLSAVSATIVGGEPIPKGPDLESQVAALVQSLVEAATRRA